MFVCSDLISAVSYPNNRTPAPMTRTAALAAAYEVRTFEPGTQKFYGGLGPNDLGVTGAICGVQLPVDANCWGRLTAYVKESTPGGKTICATLLAAKIAGAQAQYTIDVSVPLQCEIVRVEL